MNCHYFSYDAPEPSYGAPEPSYGGNIWQSVDVITSVCPCQPPSLPTQSQSPPSTPPPPTPPCRRTSTSAHSSSLSCWLSVRWRRCSIHANYTENEAKLSYRKPMPVLLHVCTVINTGWLHSSNDSLQGDSVQNFNVKYHIFDIQYPPLK